MTHIYQTPRVLHIVEADSDGNTRTVRYIREEDLDKIILGFTSKLEKLRADYDTPEMLYTKEQALRLKEREENSESSISNGN